MKIEVIVKKSYQKTVDVITHTTHTNGGPVSYLCYPQEPLNLDTCLKKKLGIALKAIPSIAK